jgi:hypothetical protein
MTYVYDRDFGINTIDFEKNRIRKMFNSDIKACDISRFDLFEKGEGNLNQWTSSKVEILNQN